MDESKNETLKEEVEQIPAKEVKLAQATFSFMDNNTGNPYSPSEVDKLDLSKEYDWEDIVKLCRFFYKREPLAATTVNRLVDIAINEILFDKNGLSDNEFKIFEGIKDQLKEFSEQIALEYLISGLVVPEIKFGSVNQDKLKEYGVKKYSSLQLPINMWVRDPTTISINKTILSDTPSYFVEIPEDVIFFIMNRGTYADTTEDPILFLKLQTYYPEFVTQVLAGKKRILLDIDPSLVLRRKVTTDTAYPTPYLFAALEAIKHKRNLRRMDYSISARVISAIMLIRLGDKDFPITEDDKGAFTDIQKQLSWRDNTNRNIERVFQLFANHTLQIDWKFPPTEALLNQEKYASVNEDILVALGFPRILITGESQRTQSSDAGYATSGPVKTMNNMRGKIETILNYIARQISKLNNFKSTPVVRFRPLQLSDWAVFMSSIAALYAAGNLSRESYAETLGYSYDDESTARIAEDKALQEKGVAEFAPLPNSRAPINTSKEISSPMNDQKGQNQNNQQLQQTNN